MRLTISSSTLLALVAAALLGSALLGSARADTVHLRSGQKIDGQAREEGGKVIVKVGSLAELNIPRQLVDRIERNARTGLERAPAPPAIDTPTPAPRPEPTAGPIATTHRVLFEDGREIRGNVLPSAADEPLQLEIGDLGIMKIARDRIESVTVEAGVIAEPAPAPALRPVVPPAPAPQPDPLDVLAAAVVEVRYGRSPAARITPALARAIESHVYELGRQRARNRVRAESHLRRIGAEAIPFLDPAAKHPFDLTRRAVQRIIRDVADPVGAPLAVQGLTDEDGFVRLHAAEALARIFPAHEVRFDPRWPESRRQQVQAHYWQAYLHLERDLLREALIVALEELEE